MTSSHAVAAVVNQIVIFGLRRLDIIYLIETLGSKMKPTL